MEVIQYVYVCGQSTPTLWFTLLFSLSLCDSGVKETQRRTCTDSPRPNDLSSVKTGQYPKEIVRRNHPLEK